MAEYTVEDYKRAARKARADGRDDLVQHFVGQAKALEAQKLSEARDRGMAGEAAYAGGAGAVRGAGGGIDFMGSVLPAMQDLSQNVGKRITGAAMNLVGRDAPTQAPVQNVAPAQTVRDLLAEKTGGYSEYKSPTTSGQFAGTIGEFAGGAAVMPLGGPVSAGRALTPVATSAFRRATQAAAPAITVPARSVGQSVLPAIGSEAAGQLTEGTEAEGAARLVGALATAPLQTTGRALTRRLALGPADDIFANVQGSKIGEAVDTLVERGVPVQAGQAVGSPRLMRLQDTLEPSLDQKVQLTRAAGRSAGIEGDNLLTPDVMKSTRDRIGGVFDEADKLAATVPTEAEGMRVLQALDDAEGAATMSNVARKLTEVSDRLSDAAGSGKQLSAADISRTRTDLKKSLTTYAKQNDQVNYELAYDLLDTLDDMVERQILQTSPELIDDLARARKEYRGYLTLERALNRAGSDAARGIVTPNALASSVRTREGTALVRGVGTDLADLANASQQVLTPAPAVSAGGVRDVGGVVKSLLDVAPSMAARVEGQSLARPTQGVLAEDLLRRLGAQTGGLLAID